MKISVEKSSIFKSLSYVQSIVEKKNTIPVLSNVLIQAKDNNLILSATDMDISITAQLNCNVIEEGFVTVSAHTLYDIIRKLPDGNEVEFISNDGKIFSAYPEPEMMIAVIVNGKGQGMPAFETKISYQETEAVIRYIREVLN